MGEELRFHEGELNVMELLWSNKSLPARDIASIINEYIGWKNNTTYTVIKRLIDKGAIKREEPGFICSAIITKQAVQEIETKALLEKVYNGSLINFFTDYLENIELTPSEIVALEDVIVRQRHF